MLERRVLHACIAAQQLGSGVEEKKTNINKNMILEFDGYYDEDSLHNMPDESGVYLVYSATYTSPDECELNKIIYIGQSKTVRTRLANHLYQHDLDNELLPGDKFAFSYARVDKNDLDQVENALVCSQKPSGNKKLVNNYNHIPAVYFITGSCMFLSTHLPCKAEPYTII